MKEKLKKQRNKLFLRIILIMLAIWVSVSAAYCVVRLNKEKSDVQSREHAKLSYYKQLITVTNGTNDAANSVLLEFTDLATGEDDRNSGFDSQMIIIDRNTGAVIADTAGAVGVRFCVRIGPDYSPEMVNLIDYHSVRDALSDDDYHLITRFLTEQRSDGNYCELICTKFHIINTYFIPLELRIVLADGDDPRFVVDDDVAVFALDANRIDVEEVYEAGQVRRNIIPNNFILNEEYHKDIIGALTKEQKKGPVEMIPQGMFHYVFYATDYLSFDNFDNGSKDDLWLIRYAREVDLLSLCQADLAVGISLLFAFFLTITVILCVMIWHTVRMQLIQEQKRLDLTNALAHDIKTPLFVISGYAYSLKDGIDEEERDLYLDRIIEQTDEVNALVHRMLSYSKLDSCNMKLNKTAFDLGSLTEEILKNYTALPDQKRISFECSGDNMIEADRELIRTVLKNLIDNAAKYSLPESVITVSVKDRTLIVSNTSEPLSKAEIKQLWQPYFQKEKSRQNGNGLGLSIVKSILDLHTVKYHTEMKDSTFNVTIAF